MSIFCFVEDIISLCCIDSSILLCQQSVYPRHATTPLPSPTDPRSTRMTKGMTPYPIYREKDVWFDYCFHLYLAQHPDPRREEFDTAWLVTSFIRIQVENKIPPLTFLSNTAHPQKTTSCITRQHLTQHYQQLQDSLSTTTSRTDPQSQSIHKQSPCLAN